MILDLDESQQRPVVILKEGFTALLDTGAFLPVWTAGEQLLISDFQAKLVQKNVPITGFGGTTYGDLYQANIQVGDLIYPQMHIVVNSELDTPFYMILSATMFQNLIYEVDDKHHKFSVSIPDGESFVRNLKIEDRNGTVYVLCESAEG